MRLEPFLASLRFHINSGGSLEPIKIYKPQVVSEIPRINLLSGVLIGVMSKVLLYYSKLQDAAEEAHPSSVWL